MTRVLPAVNAPVPTAHDGFGLRTVGIDSDSGDEVEVLALSAELLEHPGFVTALGERVARFAAVRHASYANLRRLDRPDADRLELVSDHAPGWRLSELLSESHAAGVPVDITIVIGLMRQLLPAVALYGRHNRDAAIGALAVERLIVTRQARLVIAEHAFGPALEKLNLGREKLWRQLRVAMPPSAGLPRANQRADAHAVGIVGLSLLLGRPLAAEEFPAQLQDLVGTAQEFRGGEARPLSASFSSWLTRALQFDVRTAFQAPSDAQLAFESVLASDRSYVTSSARLEEWLSALGGAIDEKKAPKPDPEVLRQQEEERARELERQRQEERQREQERQREIEREQERERELARLRELERHRAEELERLREQERQTAREVERLREQDRERELELERERERARALELASVAPPVAIDAAEPRVEAAPTAPVVPPPVEPVSVEPEPAAAAPARSPMVYLMAGAVVLLVAIVGWLLVTRDSGGMREGEGELAVQSRPQGARVVVDGKEQGVTPLTVRLSAGAHVLEVQVGKSEPRVIPLNIQAGVQTSQYIELQGVTGTGTLEVRSEPSGARVTVDGQPRGTTPATLRDLTAGDHTVVVEAGGRKATQTVKIDAGSTAQLVVPLPRR